MIICAGLDREFSHLGFEQSAFNPDNVAYIPFFKGLEDLVTENIFFIYS